MGSWIDIDFFFFFLFVFLGLGLGFCRYGEVYGICDGNEVMV